MGQHPCCQAPETGWDQRRSARASASQSLRQNEGPAWRCGEQGTGTELCLWHCVLSEPGAGRQSPSHGPVLRHGALASAPTEPVTRPAGQGPRLAPVVWAVQAVLSPAGPYLGKVPRKSYWVREP